jgi:hypothetical protein
MSGAEMLQWIWENEFAAVAGDMIAFEALSFQSMQHWMHVDGGGLPKNWRDWWSIARSLESGPFSPVACS